MNLTNCKCRFAKPVGTLLLVVGFGLSAGFPAAAAEPAAKPEPAGETSLFSGQDLRGWRVVDKFWFDKHGKVEVADGQIVLSAGQPGTGIVYEGKPPRDDYELTFE